MDTFLICITEERGCLTDSLRSWRVLSNENRLHSSILLARRVLMTQWQHCIRLCFPLIINLTGTSCLEYALKYRRPPQPRINPLPKSSNAHVLHEQGGISPSQHLDRMRQWDYIHSWARSIRAGRELKGVGPVTASS